MNKERKKIWKKKIQPHIETHCTKRKHKQIKKRDALGENRS